MPVLKFNAREFARYHEQLGKRLKPAIMRGVYAGAQRAVSYIVDQTRIAKPASEHGSVGAVNTGALLRGWKARKLPNGAAIVQRKPYGSVVEYGRRKRSRFPPLQQIQRWIQRRLGKSAKEAKAMTFVVARAIARRGLRARKILTSRKSKKRTLELVRAEVKHEILRAHRQRG